MPRAIRSDFPEGQALRAASGPLGPLALPWEFQSLHKALQVSPSDQGASPAPGHPPFLPATEGNGAAEVGWVISRWTPPLERRAPPPRGARIATSVSGLMALERRRMRRSMGTDHLDRRPRTPSWLS